MILTVPMVQASWYYLLHQFDKAGYHKFQYIVEHQQGLCNTCLSFSNKTFTLNELIQQDFAPATAPALPLCRNSGLRIFIGIGTAHCCCSPSADNHANWYDVIAAHSSDAAKHC